MICSHTFFVALARYGICRLWSNYGRKKVRYKIFYVWIYLAVQECCCLNFLLCVAFQKSDRFVNFFAVLYACARVWDWLCCKILIFNVVSLFISNQTETYVARNRRSPDASPASFSSHAIDASLAEKRIITEMGPKACVMEEPCRLHATNQRKYREQPDWTDILR